MNKVKPFIKWTGGKSQLLKTIQEKYPKEIKKYCEPFVGGGAVLFDILSKYKPKEILINDSNSELINTYNHIKYNSEKLLSILLHLQNTYYNSTEEEKEKLFYIKRDEYNNMIIRKEKSVEKASLFIFLNKTCFNGLYRVNSKGLFNVPFNKSKKPLIYDRKNIQKCSLLLQNVEIKNGDYAECNSFIDENTFVYIDPPYRPLTKTACFTSYNKIKFDDEEQKRLKDFIDNQTKKGALVLLSNSDPMNVDKNDKNR